MISKLIKPNHQGILREDIDDMLDKINELCDVVNSLSRSQAMTEKLMHLKQDIIFTEEERGKKYTPDFCEPTVPYPSDHLLKGEGMIGNIKLVILVLCCFIFSVWMCFFSGCENPNTIWSDVPRIGEHGQN